MKRAPRRTAHWRDKSDAGGSPRASLMGPRHNSDRLAPRHQDGSAGDADYGLIGGGYSRYRRPEPRIAALVNAALGGARSILNVGAGAGSYEPWDRDVTAVEPSASMRAQRVPDLPRAIDSVAEHLPFADGRFDAAMALFTVHQWPDLRAGLAEIRRVTRGPIVVMAGDADQFRRFWLNDYAPEVIAVEVRRFPSIATIVEALGAGVEIIDVPIPFRCSDGFLEAYYGRPECLLDPGAQGACSAWSFVDQTVEERFVKELSRDLDDGSWDAKYGYLRVQPEFHGSLKLIIDRP
jgi:SAM-dependent methyltransferase